jgi:uncharacterized low-complexity protein
VTASGNTKLATTGKQVKARQSLPTIRGEETMSNKTVKPVAAAIGAAFVGSMLAVGSANAGANPFGLSELNGGYAQIAGNMEGKCGGDKAEKSAEGKCGAGKCGGEMKAGEGKCGAGKCGGEMKAGEGKCGAGKCGGGK